MYSLHQRTKSFYGNKPDSYKLYLADGSKFAKQIFVDAKFLFTLDKNDANIEVELPF